MSKLDIIRVWKKAEESQPHRTNIEDLSAVGYELSKEELQFVSGAAASQPIGIACTCPTCGCDDCHEV